MNRKQKIEQKLPIDDKEKRSNFLCKRKKTLTKKARELSELCNVDVLLLIRDKGNNKLYEYNRGCNEKNCFNLHDAIEAYNACKVGDMLLYRYELRMRN